MGKTWKDKRKWEHKHNIKDKEPKEYSKKTKKRREPFIEYEDEYDQHL